MPESPGPDAVAQLCPACGLCCNGVLFRDVELQKLDSPKLLAALGLDLEKKGRKLVFRQPCHCYNGRLCAIYPHRPRQCRAFECGVLKRVQAGQTSTMAALRLIVRTRRRVQRVQELLRALGDSDEGVALTQRYKRVLSQPVDMSQPRVNQMRGRLLRAMDALMADLHRTFLK